MMTTAELVYGLLAMLLFGISTAVAKVSLRENNPVEVAFYMGLVNTVFYITLIAGLSKSINLQTEAVRPTALIVVLSYFPLLFLFRALAMEKVGLVAPITNSSVLFTIIFSFLFFAEKPKLAQAVAMSALILGLVLVTYKPEGGKIGFSKGIKYAFGACILWGLLYSLLLIPNRSVGPIVTAFFIEAGVFVGAAVHLTLLGVSKGRSINTPDRKNFIFIIVIALSAALAFLCFNAGTAVKFRTANVTAITFSYPLIVAIWGKVFYKENLMARQWLGIVIIIGSIVCLRMA